MAELDYAYLAEFAKVAEGLLTAVGASFTHLRVPELPVSIELHIAGRIRAGLEERPRLTVAITSPSDEYEIRLDGVVDAGGARPYGAEPTVGMLFTVSGVIPLIAEGIYTVVLSIEDELVRTLRFEVAGPSVQPGRTS